MVLRIKPSVSHVLGKLSITELQPQPCNFFLNTFPNVSDPLDSSKGLPAIPLLNSYMNIILIASRKQVMTLACISKGVKGVEVWIADIQTYHTIPLPPLAEGHCRRRHCGVVGTELPEASGLE